MSKLEKIGEEELWSVREYCADAIAYNDRLGFHVEDSVIVRNRVIEYAFEVGYKDEEVDDDMLGVNGFEVREKLRTELCEKILELL